jgi:hypothetical protein
MQPIKWVSFGFWTLGVGPQAVNTELIIYFCLVQFSWCWSLILLSPLPVTAVIFSWCWCLGSLSLTRTSPIVLYIAFSDRVGVQAPQVWLKHYRLLCTLAFSDWVGVQAPQVRLRHHRLWCTLAFSDGVGVQAPQIWLRHHRLCCTLAFSDGVSVTDSNVYVGTFWWS